MCEKIVELLMPQLYIIAGPNGAGKTTAAFTLLPELLGIKEFVNADEIARGISPFNVEAVAIQAGKIMLTRIDELLTNKISFAYETTLTTISY
jgi:predicted ABC-type ATPase